ncbi:MAG: hypothetical protein KatS3mg129_1886 [Leptospiraceae bacterium]|nr:MAG: hypothetical protein KatS3mg129_1886 [Leptospiraceae bacterium]
MKITLYSNIFKLEDQIFIIEIFRNKEDKKFMSVRQLNEILYLKNNFSISEHECLYCNNTTNLVFYNEKTQKINVNIKKELTFSLENLNKDNYIVYIEYKHYKKKIIKLDLT